MCVFLPRFSFGRVVKIQLEFFLSFARLLDLFLHFRQALFHSFHLFLGLQYLLGPFQLEPFFLRDLLFQPLQGSNGQGSIL